VLERRQDGRPLRIGHRGAAALAPANTLESLQAAVAAGVDVVEFDVLEHPRDGLVLAHSHRETAARPLPLEDALAWIASTACGAHVDLKGVGFERRIVDRLGAHGLAQRSLVSTSRPPSVRRLAAIAPDLPRALSYPEDRLGVSGSPGAAPFVAGGLAAMRRVLPLRIGRMLARSGATVASLHHALLTRATVERVHALGIPVIAWTVDDPRRAEELARFGVDGVVTNDPRIFEATLAP
jgi:glycerophosphoryl diester phosphodiesterase